jgi:hypothetical protein
LDCRDKRLERSIQREHQKRIYILHNLKTEEGEFINGRKEIKKWMFDSGMTIFIPQSNHKYKYIS